MKKLVLLFCITLIVTGCKKDGPLLKLNNNLMGVWSLQSNKMEYYGDSGLKEYEEVLNGKDILQSISFMQDLHASIQIQDAGNLPTQYNIINENNIIYIELYDAAIFESFIWRITSNSATSMTWKGTYTNIQYENLETQELLTAPKAELTLQFTKQ